MIAPECRGGKLSRGGDLFADAGQVELGAGAVGFARHPAMGVDVGGGDVVLAAEELHEVNKTARLGGGGAVAVEVADEADADAVLVVILVGRFAVGAVLLLGPARADLDTAV